jgi:DNA-binding MarR family transcriptional regulator
MAERTRREKVRPDHRPADQAADAGPMLKLEEFFPYRLNTLAANVSQCLTPIYRDRHGFGLAEWRTVMTLGQHGTMTAKMIGLHNGMLKAKVSRAVALLESKKLITRRSNRDDLREAHLSLTPAGRAIYADLARQSIAFNRRIGNVIDPVDRATFERVFASLVDFSQTVLTEIAASKTRDDD